MPVTFQSKSHASITMLNQDAEKMLEILGHTSIPGAIRAEDIPAALALLHQASSAAPEDSDSDSDSVDDGDGDDTVSMKTRSQPLIDLLEHALKHDEILMWDR